MLALGDSLTHGTGATPQTSYPSRLAELSGWNVVNAGVPGETAAEGCARLPALIDEHRPQLVLVLLGGNDFLRRRPESDVRSALQQCVGAARAMRTPIALLPVPRFGAGGLANAPLYEDVARSLEVPLVDSGLADLLSRRSLRSDAVHLNEAGYHEMARIVAENLRAAGWLGR